MAKVRVDRTPTNTDKRSARPCHAHRGAHECILDSTCRELIGAQPFNDNVDLVYFSRKYYLLNLIRSARSPYQLRCRRDARFVTNLRRGSIFKCAQAVLRAMAPPARRDRVGAGSLATPRPNQVHRRPQTPRHANATSHDALARALDTNENAAGRWTRALRTGNKLVSARPLGGLSRAEAARTGAIGRQHRRAGAGVHRHANVDCFAGHPRAGKHSMSPAQERIRDT